MVHEETECVLPNVYWQTDVGIGLNGLEDIPFVLETERNSRSLCYIPTNTALVRAVIERFVKSTKVT